jgi:hypothetical protein
MGLVKMTAELQTEGYTSGVADNYWCGLGGCCWRSSRERKGEGEVKSLELPAIERGGVDARKLSESEE